LVQIKYFVAPWLSLVKLVLRKKFLKKARKIDFRAYTVPRKVKEFKKLNYALLHFKTLYFNVLIRIGKFLNN
jgi:hypothetical protein